MVKLNQPGRMQSLVDMDDGIIGREIFVDTDIYQQELERVFARTWLYIGHESQIPNPNDFFISRMGEESVILTRDRQGEIHVLLNTCRHRGMKVCRYDEGNTPVFLPVPRLVLFHRRQSGQRTGRADWRAAVRHGLSR